MSLEATTHLSLGRQPSVRVPVSVQTVSLVCLQELERQKHMCRVLQHKMEELAEGLRQRDELIEVRARGGAGACL